MSKSKYLAVTLFVITTLYLTANAVETKRWYSWETGLKEAKRTQKIILVKVTQSGCHYCENMQRDVFDNKEVKTFIQKNFIPVAINISHETMPMNLSVTITPSFYFISADEIVLKKIPGAWGKDEFMDMIQNIIKRNKL